MLVITRKLGEKITVGDEIVITLIEIKGSQARIGIDAPREISVHRQEIYERIREENLDSSGIRDKDLSKAAALLGTRQ